MYYTLLELQQISIIYFYESLNNWKSNKFSIFENFDIILADDTLPNLELGCNLHCTDLRNTTYYYNNVWIRLEIKSDNKFYDLQTPILILQDYNNQDFYSNKGNELFNNISSNKISIALTYHNLYIVLADGYELYIIKLGWHNISNIQMEWLIQNLDQKRPSYCFWKNNELNITLNCRSQPISPIKSIINFLIPKSQKSPYHFKYVL